MKLLVVFCLIAGEFCGTLSLFENICPQSDTPIYLRNEYNCSEFYQCASGKLVLLSCPGILHFNVKLDVCDRPENAKCVPTTDPADKITETPMTTEKTTDKTTTLPLPDFTLCSWRDQDYYTDYLNDCTKGIWCEHGVPYIQYCEEGYWWDNNHISCIPKEDADCPWA
ncbi:unnamed protein product [Brassicogethes aeneus]|uniref:Chitin-binding type-2 domain-containing protein n=1 Tax=Brassicogethes aeneus TaxID=1431903 RepID=A0A9P0FGE9_BRAAE|nr:unnamed protein product [Brassicogethes aeneus]CAH0555573.1 unnamed protein product [Brassicogethes aeneus]